MPFPLASSARFSRRRALHAKIVNTIETRHPDRISEQLERLAHHALRAELWEKAVTYLQQAGAKAFARSSNREALTYFEQALTALTHLPETREKREQGLDIRFGLRHALFPLAELDKTERYLKEAEILATTLGDQRRLGWVWGYLCTQAMWTGRPATEVDMFAQRVNAIGATLGDVPLQVAGQMKVAAAEGHYSAALALASELGMRPPQAHCNFGLGKLDFCVGNKKEAKKGLPTAMNMYCELNMQFWIQKAEMEMHQLQQG